MNAMEQEFAERGIRALDRIGDLLALLVDQGRLVQPDPGPSYTPTLDDQGDAEERAEQARAEIERADLASRVESDRLLAEARARTKAGIAPKPLATNAARLRGRPKETA